MLKRLAIFAVLAFAVSALAAGTGVITTSYQLDAVNGPPSGPTAGIAMGGANVSGNQVPIRSLIVTVTSHVDAGTGTESIVGGNLYFWRSQTVSTQWLDGGTQWSRLFSLDTALVTDAGVGGSLIRGDSSHATRYDLSSGGWGNFGDSTNQLYVSTYLIATDGGDVIGAGAPIPHTVTLEGRY